MKRLSNTQEYEKAQKIKEQIKKVESILTSYHAPAEFLMRPGLVNDLALSRLKDLTITLELKKTPGRIECYDISNLGGHLATGSMVVFTNGQSDKSQYRRFRIKFSYVPDDYEMIKEILTRRFNHDWPLPDLVIIDGGRGQLNTGLFVIRNLKLTTPIIAVAKRLEHLYLPKRLLPISLPKESLARQLVTQIRDEAHRFALSYHKLIRSRSLFTFKK